MPKFGTPKKWLKKGIWGCFNGTIPSGIGLINGLIPRFSVFEGAIFWPVLFADFPLNLKQTMKKVCRKGSFYDPLQKRPAAGLSETFCLPNTTSV